MNKYLTLLLLLNVTSADEKEDLLKRQTEVLAQLNDLKMQAFDVPGFSENHASISVEEIMQKSKALIQESDEIKAKLEQLGVQTEDAASDAQEEEQVTQEEPDVKEEPITTEPEEEIASQETTPQDTEVEPVEVEDQGSTEEVTEDHEPLELPEEESEVVEPIEEDVQIEEEASEALNTEEEVADEITEKDSEAELEDREELAPAPIEMPEIETVAEEQPITPPQEQSSGIFSKLMLFGAFVTGAYYFNKKKEDEFTYKEKRTSYGSSEESMFKSWNQDPNIANRQRNHSLIDLGDDEEIYIH